ncbi:MAG: ribonuclease III [Lentisphaerae bacterium GWF2_45_14]|nr:MAG: ribonuclease III [Lentisphaerae bacterium GWF2_45_14]
MAADIKKLETAIGYSFKNPRLLREAVTHRSYSAENSLSYDNQRLEFLGDAVLEIILTEYLFMKYTEEPEGKLTKMRSALAQKNALYKLSQEIGLDSYILLGRGELESGGNKRTSTMSDAYEAVLGAMFLDSSLEDVKRIVMPVIATHFPEPIDLIKSINPKGDLQEFTQKHWNMAPKYRVLKIEGPDHNPNYTVSVSIKNNLIANGEANNRRSAESEAARNALNILKNQEGILPDES